MNSKTFIMVDGMDGSGKSSAVKAWKNYLQNEGNILFDLREYQQKFGSLPDFETIKKSDFLISGEPTYSGIGKVIRDELIKTGTNYPPLAIAESYSLDRLILYTKTLLPALKNNITIIQDRGVSSSLAYQPLMTKTLTRQTLAKLPGNALALKNAPTHLVIVTCDPALALKRLSARSEKQDNVIFERLPFLKKLNSEFSSTGYRKFFESRGTKVHYLRGDSKLDIMSTEAVNLLKKILK